MKSPFPIPFVKHIPRSMNENIDAAGSALCSKADVHLGNVETELQELYFLKWPERCPAALLPELASWFGATLYEYDSERTKRIKISNSMRTNKNRGLWDSDTKLIIDSITGYDAEIIMASDSGDWILYTSGPLDIPKTSWGILGTDPADGDAQGLDLIAFGTEIVIAGNIYVDAHHGINTAVLSAGTVARIVYELGDEHVPAFFRMYIGYINSLGQFINYATINP